MLETKNITKRYGKGGNAFDALRGIDLSIKKGESVAIVGKSGSGKSTLMHILAALDKPSDGEVLLGGENLAHTSKPKLAKIRNRKFGFIFQQFFLSARDSCIDNVALPLKIRGVPKSERNQKAKKVLEEVGLGDKLRSKAKDLSGGQKQRVCIARALVADPEVLFADEPTGNLDSATSEQIEDIMFGMHRDRGITLIVVTHDEDLASKCERQIYIKDGKLTEKENI
jgi:putative ABC transport system ATP-binding protein